MKPAKRRATAICLTVLRADEAALQTGIKGRTVKVTPITGPYFAQLRKELSPVLQNPAATATAYMMWIEEREGHRETQLFSDAQS